MTQYSDYNSENPDAIKVQIDRTRNQMSDRIDTPQTEVHPDTLKHQAKEALQSAIHESTGSMKGYLQGEVVELRDAVRNSFRQNPVPTVIVGLGLGWILLESLNSREKNFERREWTRTRGEYSGHDLRGYGGELARDAGGYSRVDAADYGRQVRSPGSASGRYRYPGEYGEYNVATASYASSHTLGDKVRELGSTVHEKTSEAVGQIQNSTGQMVNQMGDKAQQLSRQALHISQQTEQQALHMLEENPLAIGLAAIAVGAAIGLLLPATRRENQMVGDLRDQMVEKGKSVVGEVTQRVQDIVEEAKPEIQQMASRVVQELKPEVDQLSQKVMDDVKQAGDQARNAANDPTKNQDASNAANTAVNQRVYVFDAGV